MPAHTDDAPSTALPPLVLHMDINKTMIICDPVR